VVVVLIVVLVVVIRGLFVAVEESAPANNVVYKEEGEEGLLSLWLELCSSSLESWLASTSENPISIGEL
jgi:divalent metal cation (Fe/Co/Zn/Cd) transporter